MDLEDELRRRELGRVYARRHYYKTLVRSSSAHGSD